MKKNNNNNCIDTGEKFNYLIVIYQGALFHHECLTSKRKKINNLKSSIASSCKRKKK